MSAVTPAARERGRVRRHGISNENEMNVPFVRRSEYTEFVYELQQPRAPAHKKKIYI